MTGRNNKGVCSSRRQALAQRASFLIRAPRPVAKALGLAFALVVATSSRAASANAPEFVAALTGKASSEWQASCAGATTVGSACSTNICGATIAIEPGGNPTSRVLVVNGTSYNLHDTGNPVDLAAASLLNALCTVGAGDPIVAGAGSFSMQNLQMETFMARSASSSYGAQAGIGTMPVAMLSVGGAYERGSGATNGFFLPVGYSRNLSPTQFFNLNGNVLYGSRGGGSQQADARSAPGLRQAGFALTPSYGQELRRGSSTYAFGGYLPIAYSKASLVDTDQSFSAYAVGVGGVATMTTLRSGTLLNAGFTFAGRKTGGAFSVPMTLLVRGSHPLGALLDGYATLSYGNDPVGAKTGLAMAGAGVGSGTMELGLRGMLGGDYQAVLLGFTYHQDLGGTIAVDRPSTVDGDGSQ